MSTIQDVAKLANVSIATVSHVINKTRYVSPELVELVNQAMEKLNYQPLKRKKVAKSYKQRYIGILYPDSFARFHNLLLKNLQKLNSKEMKYQFCLIPIEKSSLSINEINYYKNHLNLDGIIMSLIKIEKESDKIITNYPIIKISPIEKNSNNKSTNYLEINLSIDKTIQEILHKFNRKGHSVMIIYKSENAAIFDEVFQSLSNTFNIENNFCEIKALTGNEIKDVDTLKKIYKQKESTSFLCLDHYSRNCFLLLQSFSNIQVPSDFSVMNVSFNDSSSFITRYIISTENIAKYCLQGLNGYRSKQIVQVRNKYSNGITLAPIARGPFGEKAQSTDCLILSRDEINKIKSNHDFTVGVSFHQGTTLWAKLHEKGIRDVFNEFDIPIVAVMNANFDAKLQNKQLESLIKMGVDAIISIPVDGTLTSNVYREIIDNNIKLILITNVPKNILKGEYVTCISVNEQKNGAYIAQATGEFMKLNNLKYLGLINHGADFFATKQRDASFKDTVEEEFPEIEISGSVYFHDIDNVKKVTKKLIQNNPIIEVLYICWEEPARAAMEVLKEMNREDIKIFTSDIGIETAGLILDEKNIIATSSQRFYEQGRAMALATINSFLEKKLPSFIAIDPYLINKENLDRGWEVIAKEKLPINIQNK